MEKQIAFSSWTWQLPTRLKVPTAAWMRVVLLGWTDQQTPLVPWTLLGIYWAERKRRHSGEERPRPCQRLAATMPGSQSCRRSTNQALSATGTDLSVGEHLTGKNQSLCWSGVIYTEFCVFIKYKHIIIKMKRNEGMEYFTVRHESIKYLNILK